MEHLFLIAQTVSIMGAAFLSGFIACFSHAGVPTLNVAPIDILVHEFKIMYSIGKSTSPVIAIAVTVCNGFLAFSTYRTQDPSRPSGHAVSPFALYVAATLCVPCIVPFTILYMEPAVNRKLLDLGTKVENGSKVEQLGTSEKEIRDLLTVWMGLNFIRAAIVGTGALLSTFATFAS